MTYKDNYLAIDWSGLKPLEKVRNVDPVSDKRSDLPCPQIMRDIPEYLSPVGSGLITSRSQRRDDLKRHDCVEAPPRKERGYRNERFIRKHNIPLDKVAPSLRDKIAKERTRS